jgi:hypothetical protein
MNGKRKSKKEEGKMRTAAGILMIIVAVIGFILVRAIYGQPPAWAVQYEGLLKWLSTFWAIFVGAGGIYTLKRKVWGMCLISGILCIPIGIIPFLTWSAVLADVSSGEETNIPLAIVMTLIFLAIAILPAVSVYLRKREWSK